MELAKNQSLSRTDKNLAFVFGTAFVCTSIAIAVLIPNPTASQYTVFRIVLALAAAGVGAVLPGFIDVQFKNWLRAGGAVALFVVVFFFAPAPPSPIQSGTNGPLPDAAPRSIALKFLNEADQGRYGAAYDMMGDQFQQRYDRDEVVQLFRESRGKFGKVIERSVESEEDLTDPPGKPAGHYRGVGFRTQFSNLKYPVFESIYLRDQSGEWKTISWRLFERNSSGMFVALNVDRALKDELSEGAGSAQLAADAEQTN